MRETKRERTRAAQRDKYTGDLVYQVGQFCGTGNIADDITGTDHAPKNIAEAAFFERAKAAGWTCTKRGWPDFFCVKDGQICAVEVKPNKGHPLKRNQIAIMGLLSAKGIPCYLWTPDGGFEQVKGTAKQR